MVKWAEQNFVRCSVCDTGFVKTNEYGVCASCWAELPAEQRLAVTGVPDEKVRIVTYSIPAQPGALKRFVSSAAGMAVGMTAALAAAHWLRWL